MLTAATKAVLLRILIPTLAAMIPISFALPEACKDGGFLWFYCGGLSINPQYILGQTAFVYGIILALFEAYLWRTSLGRRLLNWKIPDIRGTWRGELELVRHLSGTRTPNAPIPIIVVIKQTAFTFTLDLYTRESESSTIATDFVTVGDQSELFASYNNRPQLHLRQQSPEHQGTCILRMRSIRPAILEGEYFTSRLTAGTMRLTEHSAVYATSFQDASTLAFSVRPVVR